MPRLGLKKVEVQLTELEKSRQPLRGRVLVRSAQYLYLYEMCTNTPHCIAKPHN